MCIRDRIAGVGGTQRRIGQTLTSASGGDEVLQNGQTFTEVRLDRDLNGTTVRIRHQTTHTGELTDLVHAASSAGVRHHEAVSYTHLDVYKRQRL